MNSTHTEWIVARDREQPVMVLLILKVEEDRLLGMPLAIQWPSLEIKILYELSRFRSIRTFLSISVCII